jgi:hypothetical protein
MGCRCSMLHGCAVGISSLVLLVTLAGAATPASAADSLVRPDWSVIFSPEGKVIDLQGGVDAVFLEDNISDGIGVDMSAIAHGEEPAVNNGVVTAANDLGNGYVYAKRDATGKLQLYAGVEQLSSKANSYVEFEFNQGVIQVRAGAPWLIHGSRTAGDILVRVEFAGGTPSSATFWRWGGFEFESVATVAADGYECSGLDYLVCSGAPPQETLRSEVWDSADNLLEVRRPDSFVEVGVNVAALVGTNVEFTSIQVRTPDDIILDSFRRIGSWARPRREGGRR